jgi:hypothetical protein
MHSPFAFLCRFGKDTTSYGAGGIFRPTVKYVKEVPVETVK